MERHRKGQMDQVLEPHLFGIADPECDVVEAEEPALIVLRKEIERDIGPGTTFRGENYFD